MNIADKFKGRPSVHPLRPFLLKIRGGHLIGLGMPPELGSPCASCAEFWLKDRLVWVERGELSDLRVRRDLIADLVAENSPHVFYEILEDGTSTRLDGVAFPHPKCVCARNRFIPAENWDKKTNFAFSPITRLQCARYGTPDGNLWLSRASGEAMTAGSTISAYGVAREREPSRFAAVSEWLRRAMLRDLPLRLEQGESVPSEILQTGKSEILTPDLVRGLSSEATGVGDTRLEAVLDGLQGMARGRVLRQYATSMKNPMLVVGANNWLRLRVPFFLIQEYDLHILFYPNSMPSWVVGIAAFARRTTEAKPVFGFASSHDIMGALDGALFKILESCRPQDAFFDLEGERAVTEIPESISEDKAKAMRLNMWWTNWIYRCSKISLKDVLALESYPQEIDTWRDYFTDGQSPVSLVGLNGKNLPAHLKYVVKVAQLREAAQSSRNVRGIATFGSFQDGLL